MRDLFFRQYRSITAVDKISFTVEPGEILGYIGPNGAGKSTSIKMLTGVLKPSSGNVSVMSFDPFKDRKAYAKHIGVVFGQRTQLWWDIAVFESFSLLAKIYEVEKSAFCARLEILSEVLDLKPLLSTSVRKLSLGQRMRCDLAASMIHNPKILFLDEPTIGLDAVAKDNVRKFLRRINKEFNTTIILTTHDLKEIEELCARIIVIDKGRKVFDGLLELIKSLSGLKHQMCVDFVTEPPEQELKSLFSGKVVLEKKGERRLIMAYDPKGVSTVEILRAIMQHHEVADINISQPSIEEIVTKLYREGGNDGLY